MTTASFLKAVRLTHHYVGVFIAPALLFFAITGFLQTYSLHESKRGSSYKPPYLFVQLGSIHKHAALPEPQKPAAPKPDAAKADAPKSDKPAQPAPGKDKAPAPPTSFHWPEKIFFGFVAFGLVLSTVTGLFMAWKYSRRKVLVVITFVAGIIVPLALLPF